VLAALAFALVLQINLLTVKLSVCALALAVIYPFLKRVFWLPQAWLGVAFGFGVPMAFAAHHNVVVPLAWTVLVANVFWAIAYDTQYAMVDRDDDIKLGLKSSAILFGRHDVLAVMICYVAFLAIMIYVGYWARMGAAYFSGLVAACALVALEYLLIRGRQRERCFKAFLYNNWIGAVVFAGIAADFVWFLPLFPGPAIGR
jgi:4-hydroxybenzoate polyprenyltransferase